MSLSVTALLRRTAQTRARDVAIAFGRRQRTWSELLARVQTLAAGFRDLGLEPGDRLATLLGNCDRFLETTLACAWAGGVLTPLNTRNTLREQADCLDDSGARFLIVDDANLKAGHAAAAAQRESTTLIYVGEEQCPAGFVDFEKLASGHSVCADAGRADDDLFVIFYTGGTTGRSKGVMLFHANVVACVLSTLAEGSFAETGTYLNVTPTFHLSSMWPYLGTVCTGMKTVALPGFSPETVLAAIARENVSECLLVPTMIQRLIEHPGFPAANTRSLKRMLYGAAPMTEALLDRAISALPETEFVQVYGTTETSPIVTTLHFRHMTGAGRAAGRHRSIGRPNFGVEIEILDRDDKPLPRGCVGEIAVRAPGVMLGYWNRPEETREALRGGWLHTGDGGAMDENGFVYLVDRIKDMIISGGENIYSVEVENCVAQHPAVAQCAVIGVPDETWGERVHAFVVPRPGAQVSAESVIAHCRDRIAHYKCPRSVAFRESLPLSGAGKILKRELRRECAPAQAATPARTAMSR